LADLQLSLHPSSLESTALPGWSAPVAARSRLRSTQAGEDTHPILLDWRTKRPAETCRDPAEILWSVGRGFDRSARCVRHIAGWLAGHAGGTHWQRYHTVSATDAPDSMEGSCEGRK
jgi:hypothetical protein